MYEVFVKGEARASDSDGVDYDRELDLDALECNAVFSDYFRNKDWSEGVSGGYMSFLYENGVLHVLTRYESERELSDKELADLAEYTQGQWSDGVGEGFEQRPCYSHGDEVYVSPWHRGQEVFVLQRKLAS